MDKVKRIPYQPLQRDGSALLSELESAKHLDISISTLRRWRKKGIGPKFFLLGGILRYRINDLEEFVARHTRRGVE